MSDEGARFVLVPNLMYQRVLVADDDADLLETLATALVLLGADVVRASSGAELLEHLAEAGLFDLVITDVSMPWMTGLQVAHCARAAGLSVPVIVITGLDDADIPDGVRRLGVHATLLRKPFDLEQLHAAMERVAVTA